jgi:hypothetical protein
LGFLVRIVKSIAVLGLCQITEIDLRSFTDPSAAGMRNTIGDHASWKLFENHHGCYEALPNNLTTYFDNTVEYSACSNFVGVWVSKQILAWLVHLG